MYWQNPNSINFSPQSQKYLNSKVPDIINKLANTLITFNNSSVFMMASFITKEGFGTIRHLGF